MATRTSRQRADDVDVAPAGAQVPAAPGLTSEQASARLAEFGRNVLAEPPRPSHLGRFVANLVHLFALLRCVGASAQTSP
jgi:hypothetical protein